MSKSIVNHYKKFWIVFEKDISEIIHLGLMYLIQNEILPEKEDDISRHLLGYLKDSNKYLGKEYIPIYQSKNQPDTSVAFKEGREDQQPDFVWAKLNKEKEVKYYYAEAKRLGKSSNPLNKNYVTQGIERFRLESKGYSKNAPVGAMIGYIQNMDVPDIHKEVNENCVINNFPKLELKSEINEKGTTELTHSFERPFSVSPFRLNHFWADIRGNCSTMK